MNYNNYIVTVNENGEPYIEHWFGRGHRNPPKNINTLRRLIRQKEYVIFIQKQI